LRYRDLEKLRGTYIIGLQEKIDHISRIHPRFNQDIARTGRLSSSDPNCQNIPNTDNDKFKVRKAFICEQGNQLIVNDYQALEMRLLAAAAMEKDMIQIFLDGKDIHMGNASLVFGFPYDDIVRAKKLDGQLKKLTDAVKQGKASEDELAALQVQWSDYLHECLLARGWAKAIGFGLNYGMKENKLARSIGKTAEEALALMDQYMARYPAVKQFFAEAVLNARKTKRSFTILGRRRFLADILSESDFDRFAAERQAVNNVIQGSAADLVRMAMIKIDEMDLEDQYGCHMLMQVHDELVFECPEETCEEVQPIIKDVMEHAFPTELAVPMEASTGRGTNWADAK
jgi:DNA polymerase-1